MRDYIADATACVGEYRNPSQKHETGAKGIIYRALTCVWQCQPLLDVDKISIKGAQIRLKGDGAGI